MTPHPAPTPARTWAWLPAGVIVAAVIGAYAGSLHTPFVYDDLLAIPENPSIRSLWPLSTVLAPPVAGGLTVSGRPVLNLSFALNHAAGGVGVWGYHVSNILIHAGSALLLFGLVRGSLARLPAPPRTAANPTAPALAVAACWALHPLLTQAVTYTVQRAESLMGFFFLLTLYGFMRATAPTATGAQRRSWSLLAFAACLLGMGTKEVMVACPLLVLLYDRTFAAGSFAAAWRERSRLHLALAATWLLLAALVLSTGGNRGGTVGPGTGVPLWAYPLTQFNALTRYLALAVWPFPLVFEYGTTWVREAADLQPGVFLIPPLLGGTLLALHRRPALGFCGAWFFLILAPSSLAPGTIQMTVEHRMYLPLAALLAAAVVALQAGIGRRTWPALALAALACGVLTFQRNATYRTAAALWADTVAKRPDNPRAHDGLAEALANEGRLDAALRHRREAVRLLPNESRYHYNLARDLARSGRWVEAAASYRRSLQLDPTEARSHNNLGIVLGRLGDEGGALSHHARAVALQPAEALYHYNFGVALLRNQRPAEAAPQFAAALATQPDHADAAFNLGTALVRLGRFDDAVARYSAAAGLKPDDPDYRVALGGALLLAGRADEALAAFQHVLSRHPESAEAGLGAGNALSALGRKAEAIDRYEAALRSAPDSANLHFKLGNLLLASARITAAIPHYEAAIRLAPDDAEAHHNLGIAHARLEHWADARRGFENALRIKPDYPEARRHLDQLQAMPRQ